MSKIIFLNGDSSAGKSSVAREITSMNSIVSKVDKNEICQKIINKIKKYETIICLRHIDADGDAYGSTMGLAQLIKDNFPQKEVFTDGKNNENLSFLGKNDQLIKENYQNSLAIICDTANQGRIDSEH